MNYSINRSLAGVFKFLPIDEVHYGVGSVRGLGATLAAHGVERALLITGRTLATKTPLVEKVREAAQGRIAEVFCDTIQHVHRASVLRAAEAARDLGADGIVSFGGGTPNDTGKAVVLALAENIRTRDAFDAARVRFTYPSDIVVPPMKGNAVPMVAVSTTLSGGEFTHFSGITDEIRKVKDLYIDPKLTARAVFLDPELTLHTPLWLWLSTGMRAVDHCIEALCSTNAHPFTDALAAHALSALSQRLRDCKNSPRDLQARTQAHIAAWMSICGIANVNLGLSHGIGHQLGARNNVPHGVTSCVMMVHTMAYNAGHIGARQAQIAELMGRNIKGLSEAAAAAEGRAAVAQLVTDLELPARLRDVGVTPGDFTAIAQDAMEDLVVATNPRPVGSASEIVALLESAY